MGASYLTSKFNIFKTAAKKLDLKEIRTNQLNLELSGGSHTGLKKSSFLLKLTMFRGVQLESAACTLVERFFSIVTFAVFPNCCII